MQTRPYLWLALLIALAMPARAAPSLTITDIAGNRHNLLDPRQHASVLIFIGHDCPISNSYAPEINRIYATYGPRRIAFYIVYPESDFSVAAARQHAHDYGYKCPAVVDAAHALVHRTGVKITPEVAILAPSGQTLYRGRIDDRYIKFGKARYEARTHDLRLALDATLQHQAVVPAVTQPVGCFIPAT